MARSCVLVCYVEKFKKWQTRDYNFGTSSCKAFPEAYTFTGGSWGATWYGIWAPSSSNLERVGNQVHQDSPACCRVRYDGCIPLRGFLGNLNLT
ncbi:hypothetical protein K1719_038968 [Acacia pycnantha]|nr:hypothetical protein K1719_038968 [Acacia pycnantha]